MTSVIWIDTAYYKEISQCGSCFEGSFEFDERYGIKWLVKTEYEKETMSGLFKFEIIDQKRFLLARINYNI